MQWKQHMVHAEYSSIDASLINYGSFCHFCNFRKLHQPRPPSLSLSLSHTHTHTHTHSISTSSSSGQHKLIPWFKVFLKQLTVVIKLVKINAWSSKLQHSHHKRSPLRPHLSKLTPVPGFVTFSLRLLLSSSFPKFLKWFVPPSGTVLLSMLHVPLISNLMKKTTLTMFSSTNYYALRQVFFPSNISRSSQSSFLILNIKS